MAYTGFLEIVIGVIILFWGLVFFSFWQKTYQLKALKERYLNLYELTKLEEQLKNRNWSFKKLDAFGHQFKKQNVSDRDLKEIDSYYEEEKKEERKGK